MKITTGKLMGTTSEIQAVNFKAKGTPWVAGVVPVMLGVKMNGRDQRGYRQVISNVRPVRIRLLEKISVAGRMESGSCCVRNIWTIRSSMMSI